VTRLRLALLLAAKGELCVCALARGVDAPLYRVSRHLSRLRSAGLVEARREGTWMHYRLRETTDGFPGEVMRLLAGVAGARGLLEEDLRRVGDGSCRV
jgi:ArsR family transcriptional regulator